MQSQRERVIKMLYFFRSGGLALFSYNVFGGSSLHFLALTTLALAAKRLALTTLRHTQDAHTLSGSALSSSSFSNTHNEMASINPFALLEHQSTQDDKPRPLIFKEGKQDARYIDVEHAAIAYRHIRDQYRRSPAFQEMEAILTPMIGNINRIVTVGLGRPWSGKPDVFAQLAMILEATALL